MILHSQSSTSLAQTTDLLQSILQKNSKPTISKLGESMSQELFSIFKIFLENSKLTETILNPGLSVEVKYNILADLFTDKVERNTLIVLEDLAGKGFSTTRDFLYSIRYLAQFCSWETAKLSGSLTNFQTEIFTVVASLLANDELDFFFRNQVSSIEDKAQVLRKILSNKVDKQVAKLIVNSVSPSLEGFTEDLNNLLEVISSLEDKTLVKIYTAVAMSSKQQQELQVKLNRLYGDIIPMYFVNPELIGGMVIKFKNQVIDSSVSRKLKTMRTVLC